MQAVATFDGLIKGSVVFSQERDQVILTGSLSGFHRFVNGKKDSKHGLHVHVNGDLRKGCDSACQHFNPFNQSHGDLTATQSHAGDLGNIVVNDQQGRSSFVIQTNKISLSDPVTNIIGRTLIVHADEDDLGLGHFDDSLTTGHAGKRIGCAIIGVIDQIC